MRLTGRISRAERAPNGACRLCGRVDTKTALVQSKEWADLQCAMLDALQPFPEARQAIADALAREDAGTPERTR